MAALPQRKGASRTTNPASNTRLDSRQLDRNIRASFTFLILQRFNSRSDAVLGLFNFWGMSLVINQIVTQVLFSTVAQSNSDWSARLMIVCLKYLAPLFKYSTKSLDTKIPTREYFLTNLFKNVEKWNYQQIQLSNNKFINVILRFRLTWLDCSTMWLCT